MAGAVSHLVDMQERLSLEGRSLAVRSLAVVSGGWFMVLLLCDGAACGRNRMDVVLTTGSTFTIAQLFVPSVLH